mgnify:CR=1 FL=1
MDKNSDSINGSRIRDVFNRPAQPIVGVDVEKYKVFLDDPALTEAQKEEFLQALWSIIVAFVELGFGVHPLQEVYDSEDEHSSEGPKEAFNRAERPESNRTNKRNGGRSGSPELE